MAGYYGPPSDVMSDINALLSLPATGKEQDWEIELGDWQKVEAIICLLEGSSLGLEHRSALWLLLMGSLEDGMSEGHDPMPQAHRAAELLKADPENLERMGF